jgi:putative transposase
MSKNFHLPLRPEPGHSISRILQSLAVTHTWRYHKRHRSSGHVWQGRFKSPVIQDDAHLLVVLRYIEANPLRAQMVTDPADYRWSSFPHHGLGHADPLVSGFPEWEELGMPVEPEHAYGAFTSAAAGERAVEYLLIPALSAGTNCESKSV